MDKDKWGLTQEAADKGRKEEGDGKRARALDRWHDGMGGMNVRFALSFAPPTFTRQNGEDGGGSKKGDGGGRHRRPRLHRLHFSLLVVLTPPKNREWRSSRTPTPPPPRPPLAFSLPVTATHSTRTIPLANWQSIGTVLSRWTELRWGSMEANKKRRAESRVLLLPLAFHPPLPAFLCMSHGATPNETLTRDDGGSGDGRISYFFPSVASTTPLPLQSSVVAVTADLALIGAPPHRK